MLYADWTVNSYTITFVSNGGSDVTAITQDFGTSVTAPSDPTKTGYTFAGWYSDAGLTTAYTFTTMPASNTTAYAKWTINSYTITFNSNGGSAVADITQNYGTSVAAPTAPTRTGYTFAGWFSESGLSTPYTFTTMPASNTTAYAKWTINSYTLTYAALAHGSIVGPSTQSVDFGSYGTTATATPDTGYHFVAWSDGVLTAARKDGPVSGDLSANAIFAIDVCTITFNSNGGSAVADITQDYGSAVTAPTAPTKAGYTFVGWCSDSGLTAPYTFTTMPASNITLYAKWTASSHTITFNSNGGSAVADITQDVGSAVTAPTAPTKTGYTFAGWYSDAELSLPYTFTTMPASNITLYADWTVDSHTISFESNGGSAVAAITQDFGTSVSAPTAPTKTGYTFAGWYSNSGLTTLYEFTTMPASNITLYAKWTANSYTMTFNSNGGSAVADITQDFGSAVSAPTAPTKAGYTFAGWYSSAELLLPYTFTTMPASSFTLYADWTANSYTITFNSNGGSAVADITQDFGSAVAAPTAPTKTGYVFAGWYSNSGLTTAYTFTTMPLNTTLYAKWTINTYTLTYAALAHGSIVGPSSQVVDFGSDGTTVTATPDTGYHFVVWGDGGLTAARRDMNVVGDITVNAVFEVSAYAIAFNSDGGSVVGGITQDFGSVVTTPTAPTKAGYVFSGWYSNSGLTTAYTFTTMPASNITLYAKWTANSYTITFNSNGGSAVGDITQDAGTPLSAPTAPTKAGYTFAGWHSDAGLTTSYSFTTMPASNITLYADWTVDTYTITFNSNGGSAVTAITQGSGSAVAAPSDPTKAGYAFAGWYSNSGLTTPYTFTTMPASNTTLYAKWTVNSYTITFNSNGGSAVTAITQDYGTSVSAPTAPTKAGYTFAGWHSDAGLTTSYSFTTMPASSITLYADWTVDSGTITFNSNGGSAVTAITQGSGSAVTAPTDPTKAGYTFVGWYSNSGLTTAYTFTTMPASNITVYAKWTANSYTITFNSNGGSSVGAITQDYGTSVSVPTAPTKAGYTFAGWHSDAGLTTSYSFTTMHLDMTLYADWTIRTYALTYTAGSHGSITGVSPQTVSHGSDGTTVTATPDTGYHFVSWSDAVATAERRDLAVVGSVTASATFAIDTFKVTSSGGMHGSITPLGDAWLDHGSDSATYTITPSSGYAIGSVVVDGVSVGAPRTYKFLDVTGNHTISVTFKRLTSLTIASSRTTIYHGWTVKYSGTISPSMSNGTHVIVEIRKLGSSTWTTLTTVHTYSSHHWTYTYHSHTRHPGTYYVRARYAGSGTYMPSISVSRKMILR
jgi:uncharacterized repeat protein (TIGR02543 family)